MVTGEIHTNERRCKVFCSRCGNQYEGTPVFCSSCGLRLDQGLTVGSNWFRRHLNWTLVIALVAINAATFVLVFLAYYFWITEVADAVYWLCLVGNIILTAIVGAWVLGQKGRSLWWLLLTPFWIGWVVWLSLDNKRQISVWVHRPQTNTLSG
jgi:hypothetical protein